MSLVNLTSDLGKFKKPVKTPEKASTLSSDAQERASFGSKQPITEKLAAMKNSTTNTASSSGNTNTDSRLGKIVTDKRNVSMNRKITSDVSPIRQSVTLESLASKVVLPKVDRVSNATKFKSMVEVRKSDQPKVPESTFIPNRVRQTGNDISTVQPKMVDNVTSVQTFASDVNKIVVGTNNNTSPTTVRVVNNNTEPRIKKLSLGTPSTTNLTETSPTVITKTKEISKYKTSTTNVVVMSKPTGHHLTSPVKILAGAMVIDHSKQGKKIVNTTKLGGRYEQSNLTLNAPSKTFHGDGDVLSKFNIDTKLLPLTGKFHEDGDKVSKLNVDGVPLGGLIGGRYEKVRPSAYGFIGDAPSVNFITDIHGSGFITRATTQQTQLKVNSSAYAMNLPKGVDFFGNEHASGFNVFARQLDTKFKVDTSAYGWKGAKKDAPSVNYFVNRNANGFTTFQGMYQTLFNMDSSQLNWHGTRKDAPTVNYFQNTNTVSGFDAFAQMYNTKYKVETTRFSWQGDAPSVDYFSNNNVTEGFHTRALLMDSKFIKDSSIYDWNGGKSDAPEVNFFLNRNVTSGFHKFARIMDTKFIKDSSIYDWDGGRTDSPEVNFFSNRNVTKGFHKFAQIYDTKFIKDSSIYDWDGGKTDAPEVDFFLNRNTTKGFHKFARLLDTKYIKDSSIYDWDGGKTDAPEVDFFLNRNTTKGFHKFAQILDTKFIKDSSIYDWDGGKTDAPEVNFFLNRNVTTGFHKFARIMDSKFIKDSSIYDWDGFKNNAPAVDFFLNRNTTGGFETFAKMLDSKFIKDSSIYDWDGSAPPATNFFANTNASGFTVKARIMNSEYVRDSSRYIWKGSSKDGPATNFFANTNADGFTKFQEQGNTKYKVATSRFTWNGSAPSTNFFTDVNASGFTTFAVVGDSKFKEDSTRYAWAGNGRNAPTTNFFADDVATGFTSYVESVGSQFNVDKTRRSWVGSKKDAPSTKYFNGSFLNEGGFKKFATRDDSNFVKDGSSLTWVGKKKEAPSTDAFDDGYGAKGFTTFMNDPRQSQFEGVDVENLEYEYPDVKGFGKRLFPSQPSHYDPYLLSLTDLLGGFIPNVNDIVSDLVGVNVGSITNMSISTAMHDFMPHVLGNKTGFVIKKALGAISHAVPKVGAVLNASLNKIFQKNQKNSFVKNTLNSMLFRRSVRSTPEDSSRWMVFSLRKQYASQYGNFTQDQGESTMALNGYNFRTTLNSSLKAIGIDANLPVGPTQDLTERMRQRYESYVPPISALGVPISVGGILNVSKIHTTYNPFPASQNDASGRPLNHAGTNIYLQDLRSDGYLKYGFIGQYAKSYAQFLNETWASKDTTIPNAKNWLNNPQITTFKSDIETVYNEFNNGGSILSNPLGGGASIDTGRYTRLNRNPFDKKHQSRPGVPNKTVPLYKGPAQEDGNPITQYRTIAYNKIPKKHDIHTRYHDFRNLLDNSRNDIKWSTDPKIVNYEQKNLEKYGYGQYGKVGADRSKPNVNTIKYESNGSGKNNAKAIPNGDGAPEFRGDRINIIDYRQLEKGNLANIKEVYDGGVTDLIDFYFTGHRLTGAGKGKEAEVIVFRAALKNISDSSSPSWNSNKILGRADPVYLYGGFERSVSFDFDVFINSRDEFKAVYRKLNALMGFTAPHYDGAGYMQAPIMRLNIGHLFRKTPGFLSSLSYTFDNTTYTWETAKLDNDLKAGSDGNSFGVLQLPKFISVSVQYTIIGNYRPQKNGVFYNLYDDDPSWPGKVPTNANRVNYFRAYDADGGELGLPPGIEDENQTPKESETATNGNGQ